MTQSLAVRVLEIEEYPPKGQSRGHVTREYPMPSWEQIEAAIRSLNHYCRPFFFIGLRDTCEGEDCYSVLGGPNGYAITATIDGAGWLSYFDPTLSDREVAVWTSDQGYYPKERNVTYDVELVVRVTRYF